MRFDKKERSWQWLVFAALVALAVAMGCDFAKSSTVSSDNSEDETLEHSVEELTLGAGRLQVEAAELSNLVDELGEDVSDLEAEGAAIDAQTASLKDSLRSLQDLADVEIPTPSYRGELVNGRRGPLHLDYDTVHVYEYEHRADGPFYMEVSADADILFVLFRDSLGELELITWEDTDDWDTDGDGFLVDTSWFDAAFLPTELLRQGTYYVLVAPYSWDGLDLEGIQRVTYSTYREAPNQPRVQLGSISGTIRLIGGQSQSVSLTLRQGNTIVSRPGFENPIRNLSDGSSYQFPRLAAGTYQLTATETDFETWERKGIDLDAGESKEINIQLQRKTPRPEPSALDVEARDRIAAPKTHNARLRALVEAMGTWHTLHRNQ